MYLAKLKNKVNYLIQPDLFKRFSHHYQLRLLKKTNRYQACSTNVLGSHLNLVDGPSFYYMYKEIFENEIYAFTCDKNKPVIIDGGSNIGLSVIYFKMKYPQSEIIAFEADPTVFNILKSNIESFGYHNICLHQKALWNCETFLNFAVDCYFYVLTKIFNYLKVFG